MPPKEGNTNKALLSYIQTRPRNISANRNSTLQFIHNPCKKTCGPCS
jgi:hypothetical protein